MKDPNGGNQVTADGLVAVANASITHILRAWYWPDDDAGTDAIVYSDRVIRFNMATLTFFDQSGSAKATG